MNTPKKEPRDMSDEELIRLAETEYQLFVMEYPETLWSKLLYVMAQRLKEKQ